MPEVFGSARLSCRDAALNIVLLCFILSRTICSARGSEGQIGRTLRPTNLEGAAKSQLTLCLSIFCFLIGSRLRWQRERESTLKVYVVTRSSSFLGMPGCTGATWEIGKIQHDLPLKWLNSKLCYSHGFVKFLEFGLQDATVLSFWKHKKPYLDKRTELKAEQGAGVTFDISLCSPA